MGKNDIVSEAPVQSISASGLEFELVDLGPGYKPESSAAACLSCYCGSGCLCGCVYATGDEK